MVHNNTFFPTAKFGKNVGYTMKKVSLLIDIVP